MSDLHLRGSFTLPGEAGFEDMTLALAEKWGADAIRDSDGTQLSEKIMKSGYDIYSTVCLIRSDNEWAKKNTDKLQQTCLISFPVVAQSSIVTIELLRGYFKEQFCINTDDYPKEWWQVFDRTNNTEIGLSDWDFNEDTGTVTILNAIRWHQYTVNFFVYRIWEEISAYNHITNNWGDREHLMPVDPIYPETREMMLKYLEQWLTSHLYTQVVRFTSMFYNFFWLWTDDPNRKFIVNDWGSYGFTVSPYAIRVFEKEVGYRPSSEDFINKGLYTNSYLPPSQTYRDWMGFINRFVVNFSKECVELVHKYNKKAYVFYNDHWIGLEPTLPGFKDINFDGIIDGIFSGFEARKVAGTDVQTRELRLHPYFFPTGVNGAGTFVEGGNPELECKTYWQSIRRALLRDCVDRIGFGGYLHLLKGHPKFIDYIEKLTYEFHSIKELFQGGKPYVGGFKVAILSAWGNMRAWGCCGHFNHGNFYNELMESVSGLPLDIAFINFEDIIQNGISKDVNVIINAGRDGDSWSGGESWENAKVIETITEWVSNGGGFIGIGEPSAAIQGGRCFQLSHIMGVDKETGLSLAFPKYVYQKQGKQHFIMKDANGAENFSGSGNIYVLDGLTKVLADKDGSVQLAVRNFGSGRGVYLSGHTYMPEDVRLLHRAIFWAAGRECEFENWICSNIRTECAYYPESGKLAVINNTDESQETEIIGTCDNLTVTLEPFGFKILSL